VADSQARSPGEPLLPGCFLHQARLFHRFVMTCVGATAFSARDGSFTAVAGVQVA
jgi:hypothetical protein